MNLQRAPVGLAVVAIGHLWMYVADTAVAAARFTGLDGVDRSSRSDADAKGGHMCLPLLSTSVGCWSEVASGRGMSTGYKAG